MEPHTLRPPMIYYAYTMPTNDKRHSLIVILEGFHSPTEARQWLSEVMADYEYDGDEVPPRGSLH
jgi:hypothetical protein